MDPATKSDALPSLTADILSDPHMPADNLLARLWKVMAIPTLLSRAGIGKRSGLPAPNVVYLLLLWGWLKVSSISMFSRDSLQSFADARKDVIYDFLKREDVNWRGLHIQVARRVYQDHNLKECRIKAFVVDDSVKIRRGKKMGGVSRHFDHLTGRTVKGYFGKLSTSNRCSRWDWRRRAHSYHSTRTSSSARNRYSSKRLMTTAQSPPDATSSHWR